MYRQFWGLPPLRSRELRWFPRGLETSAGPYKRTLFLCTKIAPTYFLTFENHRKIRASGASAPPKPRFGCVFRRRETRQPRKMRCFPLCTASWSSVGPSGGPPEPLCDLPAASLRPPLGSPGGLGSFPGALLAASGSPKQPGDPPREAQEAPWHTRKEPCTGGAEGARQEETKEGNVLECPGRAESPNRPGPPS